ncbi:MAG: hypothetical protein MMC33_001477 [Icmadophila ericetorum]|nr:hypothetical protein [Icmadophila ericetorum]
MAETIAAFSLAANIIQFIDFGSRFVPAGNENEISDSERGLRQLAVQCLSATTELSIQLSKVSLADKTRKRDALKVAFMVRWKKENIESLKARLEGFRHQLTLHLLAFLRIKARMSLDQQKEVLRQLEAVSEGTKNLEGLVNQVKMSTEGIGASILEILIHRLNLEEGEAKKIQWQKDLIRAIYENRESNHPKVGSLPAITATRQKALQSAFFAPLRYSGMDDREGRIAVVHEKTFRWIFEEDSNFKDWLESDALTDNRQSRIGQLNIAKAYLPNRWRSRKAGDW